MQMLLVNFTSRCVCRWWEGAQPSLLPSNPHQRACMHNLSGVMAFENTCQRSSGVSELVAEPVGN